MIETMMKVETESFGMTGLSVHDGSEAARDLLAARPVLLDFAVLWDR